MRKTALCILLFISALAKTNSQERKFGWSFGNIGASYDFIGKSDIADINLLEFTLSFEKIGLMVGASLLYGTNRNNRSELEPFYNSFLPLELRYTPFKWKYLHLSAYGRGAWEIGYTGDVADPHEISKGFFGSLGVKAGFFPLTHNFFKYRSHIITLFSEYTTRNELKAGASLDLFDIVYMIIKIQSAEKTTGGNR
jgi:hypothetical protein